ncbi:MAG: membrane protein insertase YidC [Alphaproteobacteria bacterium]
MSDQKNLLLAIVISIAIVLGFQFLLPDEPKRPSGTAGQTAGGPKAPGSTSGAPRPQAPTAGGAIKPQAPGSAIKPLPPGGAAKPQVAGRAPSAPGAAAAPGTSRSALLKKSPRVRITTPRLRGSIALVGAKLDDLTMLGYRTELAKTSAKVDLLQPLGARNAYFVEYGWVTGQKGIALPNDTTPWTADRNELKPGQSVTLRWDNGQGLRFERIYTIDKNYLITVIQKVVNSGSRTVELFPYAVIARSGKVETSGWYVLHEGPYGVFRKKASDGGSLTEVSWDDLEDKKRINKASVGGWIGITDRYWLVALAPAQNIKIEAGFGHHKQAQLDKWQVDFRQPGQRLAPRGTASATTYLFAGAKEIKVIDAYADKPGLLQFDLAIDFGWFYFLTKPIFLVLIWLNSIVGNFGVSILLLTVVIKILFFPLANKSYRAMGKMKALTPKMQQIKERFKDQKELQNKEMMELYKREKVNPMAGCWPMLVQIPVFFALYKVLLVNIEMRHAPFFGWIQDLSARDPTSVLNLFGLLPFEAPMTGMVGMVSIGIWPLLMGISMFLQQRLNPAPPDPMQARIFMMLPIVFTFILAPFAAGLVIYWTWNNLLSMTQQWIIMKRHGTLSQSSTPTGGGPPKKAHASGGGKKPASGGKANKPVVNRNRRSRKKRGR